jgi:methionyl-tRNA formyltransferase
LIGFSCRFDKILKKKHINLFQKGIVNFHGGLLPEFGGLYSSCHTILEGAEFGGGTLHYIDDGIDCGDIISREEFKVENDDTSISIFKKTQIVLLNAFLKYFDELIFGNLKSINQNKLISMGYAKNYFDRNSLDGKKKFNLDDDPILIDRKVRAFEFPDKEPAYFVINNKKYYAKTNY